MTSHVVGVRLWLDIAENILSAIGEGLNVRDIVGAPIRHARPWAPVHDFPLLDELLVLLAANLLPVTHLGGRGFLWEHSAAL